MENAAIGIGKARDPLEVVVVPVLLELDALGFHCLGCFGLRIRHVQTPGKRFMWCAWSLRGVSEEKSRARPGAFTLLGMINHATGIWAPPRRGQKPFGCHGFGPRRGSGCLPGHGLRPGSRAIRPASLARGELQRVDGYCLLAESISDPLTRAIVGSDDPGTRCDTAHSRRSRSVPLASSVVM